MGKIVYRVSTMDEYKRSAKERVIKAEGMVRHVYVDVGGVPTTANGKSLVVYGSANKWVIDPAGERILKDATGRGYTDEQRATLQKSADNLNETRPKMASKRENMDSARKANVPEFYTSDVSTANNNEGYRQRTFQPEKSTFGVNLTDEQIQSYADKVYENTESDFNRALVSRGIEVPPSKEREGLVSIYHQNPSVLSDKEVVDALKRGDRGKLIEVLENPRLMPKTDSLKVRRQDDIDMIGKPDDPVIIRHENNTQAGLDAALKQAPQAIPEREVFPKREVPVVDDVDIKAEDVQVKEPASLLDYGGLLKEQLMPKEGPVGDAGLPFVLIPGVSEEVNLQGVPEFRTHLMADPFEKLKDEQNSFFLRLFGK